MSSYLISYLFVHPVTGVYQTGNYIVQKAPKLTSESIQAMKESLGSRFGVDQSQINFISLTKLDSEVANPEAEDLADAIERALTVLGESSPSRVDNAVSILNSALASYAINT